MGNCLLTGFHLIGRWRGTCVMAVPSPECLPPLISAGITGHPSGAQVRQQIGFVYVASVETCIIARVPFPTHCLPHSFISVGEVCRNKASGVL